MLILFGPTAIVALLSIAFPGAAVALFLLLLPFAFRSEGPLTAAERQKAHDKEMRRLRRFMDGRGPDPVVAEFLRGKGIMVQAAPAAPARVPTRLGHS